MSAPTAEKPLPWFVVIGRNYDDVHDVFQCATQEDAENAFHEKRGNAFSIIGVLSSETEIKCLIN